MKHPNHILVILFLSLCSLLHRKTWKITELYQVIKKLFNLKAKILQIAIIMVVVILKFIKFNMYYIL